MSDNSKHTLIEQGTEFDGTVRSECPITLAGTLKGKLDAPSLEVTGSGSVQGNVKVRTLRSEGQVSGEIEAETVELSGRVSDQTIIRAKNLEVRLAQSEGGVEVSFGNCELEVGEAPAKAEERKGSTSSASVGKRPPTSKTTAKDQQEPETDFAEAVTNLIE